MSRKKSPTYFSSKTNQVKDLDVTNYDLSPFMPQNMTKSLYENESIETLREKLQIKSEALNLLGKQLEICNKEKNDYKRLIDTLYDKNLTLKKTLYFKENQIDALDDENFFNLNSNSKQRLASPSNNKLENSSSNSLFNDIDSDDYLKVLKDLIKTLQKEKFDLIQKNDDIQQELNDSRSDLRLLREQVARQRVGSYLEGLTTSVNLDLENLSRFKSQMTPSYSTSSLSPSTNTNGKEGLIKEIEILREQKNTIENDLKLAICQKEEIEIERDSFKEKYLKLNKFLVESSVDPNNNNDNLELNRGKISLNIDELVSQNKYLNETNESLKEEIEIMRNNLKKYKQASQTTCGNISKNKQDIDLVSLPDTNIINKNKIKILLKRAEEFIEENNKNIDSADLNQTVGLVNQLKLVLDSLVECLNDKLVAFQHQRKVNKMLASRIQDLEKQIESFNFNLKKNQVNTSPFSTSSLTPLRLPEPLRPNRSNEFNSNSTSLIKFECEESQKSQID